MVVEGGTIRIVVQFVDEGGEEGFLLPEGSRNLMDGMRFRRQDRRDFAQQPDAPLPPVGTKVTGYGFEQKEYGIVYVSQWFVTD